MPRQIQNTTGRRNVAMKSTGRAPRNLARDPPSLPTTGSARIIDHSPQRPVLAPSRVSRAIRTGGRITSPVSISSSTPAARQIMGVGPVGTQATKHRPPPFTMRIRSDMTTGSGSESQSNESDSDAEYVDARGSFSEEEIEPRERVMATRSMPASTVPVKNLKLLKKNMKRNSDRSPSARPRGARRPYRY